MKNNSKGFEFIQRLQVSDDENKLVRLAKEAIDESHDQRTFLERKNKDLRFNPCGVNIGNVIAIGHAMANNDFTTKDKLYMVLEKYINLVQQKNPLTSKDKALERFEHNFAAAFPKEYGVKEAVKNEKSFIVNNIKSNRSMGL